jgi:hypothetical protein
MKTSADVCGVLFFASEFSASGHGLLALFGPPSSQFELTSQSDAKPPRAIGSRRAARRKNTLSLAWLIKPGAGSRGCRNEDCQSNQAESYETGMPEPLAAILSARRLPVQLAKYKGAPAAAQIKVTPSVQEERNGKRRPRNPSALALEQLGRLMMTWVWV